MPERQGSAGEARAEYARRLQQRRAAVAVLAARHNRLGFLRMATVFSAIAIAYGSFRHEALSAWWLLAPGAVFLLLGGLLQRVLNGQQRLSRAISFYERCQARLDGRWANSGESGARFLDEHHPYAQDLDLFGNGSLFQLLSSARTGMGEETLAAWLLQPSPPETLRARHQALRELAPQLDLREDLAVLGEHARAGVDPKRLLAWGERPPVLQSSRFRLAAWALSSLGALTIAVFVALLASWPGLVELPQGVRNALPAGLL